MQKEIITKIFEIFCSTNDRRPNMAKPFVKNAKVYATDGHAAVCISEPNYDIDCSDTPLECPNVEALMLEHSIRAKIDINKINKLEGLPSIDWYAKIGDACFLLWNIKRLLFLSRLLKTDVFLMNQKKDGVSLFSVGECEVLVASIMPEKLDESFCLDLTPINTK